MRRHWESSVPLVKVLYHGHCFDGFSSAAVFSRFYRECIDSTAHFVFEGLRHGAPIPVDVARFDADVHAILDFRYSPSSKLDWWFDHHKSAFLNPNERAHFDGAQHKQHFWDPTAPSCCGFIARTIGAQYDFDSSPLHELIEWADEIDSAQFPDAKTAVELEAPALQLMTVVQEVQDGELADQIISGLANGEVSETAELEEVQSRFATIKARYDTGLRHIREVEEVQGDVFFANLLGARGQVSYNKFAPYYFHPLLTYVVVVSQSSDRVRISVGSNPWRPEQRRHDIAEICEKYGGGGHPVVGGITVPGITAHRAIQIGREIVDTLLN
jgi:hypothetical protein